MADSLTTKRRSAYTLSTVSVTLVLFVIGALLYLGVNSAKVSSTITDNVRVVVILDSKADSKDAESITQKAKESDVISRSEYVTAEDAAREFNTFIGEDLEVKLGTNPLPSSVNLYIKKSIEPKEGAAKIRAALKGDKMVDEILFSESLMESVTTNLNNFKLVLAVFMLALMFISVIMINNTIRMAIFSKRFLIKSMLLIGATRGFIRRPFVSKAILQAFVSTFFATLMLTVMVVGLKRSLPEIELVFENYQLLMFIPITLFIVGLLVCLSSTIRAVNRYMRLRDDQLHIY